MKSSRKDTEFGNKLDYLEGILGAQLPMECFQKKFQANWIETGAEQFSRKRNGTEAVSNRALAKLIDLFQIGEKIDFQVFRLELKAFIQALVDAKVGTHGNSTSQKQRQLLLSLYNANHPVAICRASAIRAGGIGGDPAGAEVPQFRVYDRVYLHVPVPADGHLLVLNDTTNTNELTCLMPSTFAPETAVTGNSVRVPTQQHELPYFKIGGPTGFYRIFAIWTKENLISHALGKELGESTPAPFNTANFESLCKKVEHLSTKRGKMQVMIADYWVR